MLKRMMLGAAALSLLAGISPAMASASVAGQVSASWHVSYRQVGSAMDGVTTTGRNSAWAFSAGWQRSIVHWNGRRWRHVALPARLWGLAIASSAWDNVWFCGQDASRNFISYVWGGSGWAQVAMTEGCDSLEVLGLRDTWTLGDSSFSPQAGYEQAVWHWNGIGWTDHVVHLAGVAMSGSSSRSLYIVGSNAKTGNGVPGPGQLVAYRWSGASWRWVHLPHLQIRNAPAVDVASSRNIWVVASQSARHSKLLHWNGARWRRIAVPAEAAGAVGVTASGSGRAWLSGWYLWTGSRWEFGGVDGVAAAVPGTDSTWLAAPYSDSKDQQLGIVFYNGKKP